MKFGICYNVDYHREIHGEPSQYYAEILDQCSLLDQLGYHSAWFSEHHSGSYSFGNPALMLIACAQRTTRLRVGTGVSLLPLRQPQLLSEEYAMVDQMSGGRLEYGVGRGYLLHEYPWLNVPLSESTDRYRESLDFIRAAWTCEGTMSFDGTYFHVNDYQPFPPVVQRPTPPIFASAVSPESFVYAGEQGLHLGVSIFSANMDTLRADLESYRRALILNSHDPAEREVMGITQMFCADDEGEALERGRIHAENYYKFFAQLVTSDGAVHPAAEFMGNASALAINDRNQALFGSPAALVRKIQWLREELGFTYLQLEVAQGGCDPASVRSALTLFAKEVMPHFE